MITTLYDRYFQKSRSFLYPALGYKRVKPSSLYSPIQTYISIENIISELDMKLICQYKYNNSEEFLHYEDKYIYSHPLFERKIDDGLYIFNFSTYEKDWKYFLEGKYSKFSEQLKNTIKTYYGGASKEYTYIHSFLYPEKYYNTYSKLLDIDSNILKINGELCDIYNIEKETLILSDKLVNVEETL